MKLSVARFIKKRIRNIQFKRIDSDFILNKEDPIQKKGELIEKEVFCGGLIEHFSMIGRLYLITLLKIGLTPESKVLDVGCGALRGGFWLIHFLNPNRYFGLEPNIEMLNVGKRILIESKVLDHKNPKFDHNSDFNFSVFNEKFDFMIARSIWTHTSKNQISTMLKEFVANSNQDGTLLASYKKPYSNRDNYNGNEWVGRSHDSSETGTVFHSFEWLEKECAKNGLTIKELKFDYYEQIWLHVSRI